nr:hypothetical protein BHI3_07470 [Bacteriovorax sp. HI3]
MNEILKGQMPLFEELKMDNPEGKKVQEKVNVLQEMLLELMDERKVTLSQIQKETGIPWGTLMDWHNGDTNVQKLDKNILKLAQFFNVHIHYLVYGIGTDEPAFEGNN